MRAVHALLPLALLFSAPASAARLEKLADTELAALTADPAADEDDRLDATELLLERRALDDAVLLAGGRRRA